MIARTNVFSVYIVVHIPVIEIQNRNFLTWIGAFSPSAPKLLSPRNIRLLVLRHRAKEKGPRT